MQYKFSACMHNELKFPWRVLEGNNKQQFRMQARQTCCQQEIKIHNLYNEVV